jgi:glutamate dehydrogenase/leucine dehydrogenase
VQGANIPFTPEAEAALAARGVPVVPDFIANAGGVIMAAMEYARKAEKEAFQSIAEKIRENTDIILRKVFTDRNVKLSPRAAAMDIARQRVIEAQKYREY